jgi:hypothetical protein
MDVKEVIKLVSDLSVGIETPTSFDEEIYLRYLNLVHFELYRGVGTINPYVPLIEEEYAVEAGTFEPNAVPFVVRSVYVPIPNNARVLSPISYDEILKQDPNRDRPGLPQFWFYMNKKMTLYPSQYEGPVRLITMGTPERFTIETLEEQIPYPPLYHQVLVDGTCYYLFQGEMGLKNQAELVASQGRWEKGKKELYSYLMTLSGTGLLSTYSEV